jgi:NAD(P)-dependent dehydrogenase (short-subunit alcohol dehydrogenase family)
MVQDSFAEIFSLAGRVALVTGASGGIGQHLAGVLHAAGASVVLGARRHELVAAQAARLGERAAAIAMDVSDEASLAHAMEKAAGPFGTCDILINNAGIAITRPFLEQDAADWDAVMAVNLRGAFLVAQHFARRLVQAQLPGCIVNITSILGQRTIGGVAPYTAAKAGLDHLTRVMAVELARHRIRVNALAPGYIDSAINRGQFDGEAGRAMLKRVPQRRTGTLAELNGPILLLTSNAGSHMTGAVLVVDGGHSISAL